MAENGGVAGSVHRVEAGALHITGALRLPPPVIAATTVIPRGKGMAGLAWERNTPIQTCNLQTDASGTVKPGARAVSAQAALALPVRSADGAVIAIVGIAWADERVLDDAATASLMTQAGSLRR